MSRVYVSSTLLDLRAEREAVINWLTAADHQPVHSYVPDSNTVRDSCLEDVDTCDIHVLMLGHRYGFQPEKDNPENLSITHLEYRRAKSRGIPTIALVRTDVNSSDIDSLENQERLDAFRDEVGQDVRPGRFSNVNELIHSLSASIVRRQERMRHPRPSVDELRELFKHASADLFSWRTTLPDNRWLERPELDVLQQRINNDPQSLTLLLGEPGCGKSALLARLGRQLKKASIPVLGIKLDFFPETIQDQNALKDYFRLDCPIVECVRILAKEGKVVILVDQLDALADLVVQYSGRLRVPLELIRDLAELDNVHVVASCRIFEHRHDPRLRNLEADVLTLDLPNWEQIDAALQAHGVQTAAWNESMKAELRSPHALDTFLRLVDATNEADLLRGYQHMLEASWKQSVLSDRSGKRRALLLDLAELMAEREVLWLPLAICEDRYAVVQELQAAGILIEESGRIGFRHQTLFEFVRAKSFLEQGGRLTDLVLSRQDSLRIRPQIWHALGYMRDVDRKAYLDEAHRLWEGGLRIHLRILLIEFLGHLQDPEPAEAALFFNKFDDAWHQDRILSAIVGSRGWFASLAPRHLPIIMSNPAQEASRSVPILIEALVFDRASVFQLIDAYWMPDQSKDILTWQVLERAGEWQPQTVDRCCKILSRTDFAAWTVNSVISAISLQLPEQAPRLLAARFEKEWKGDSTNRNGDESRNENEAPIHDLTWDSPEVKRCRKILEGHDLYDLPAVAEAAPGAFIDEIWPWFVRMVTVIAREEHPFVVGYRDIFCLIDDNDDEDEERVREDRAFLSAVTQAVMLFARNMPEEYLAFMKANEHIDIAIVQRLLAKGLCQIASMRAGEVLEYLCVDSRRLVLGTHSDVHRDSKDLIRAVAPHLDAEQLLRLEQLLISWEPYTRPPDEGAETRRERMRWARRHRLRLLRALPMDRMSDMCRRHMGEEERAFPGLDDHDMRLTGGWIGSPVRAEQMEAGEDQNIINLFNELTDDHGWDHPRARMKGGAIQAGRELAKLAEKDPERAIRLVRGMQPERNEIPVGDVLESLAKIKYDPERLYGLILELAEKGFRSEWFRRSASWAVEKVVEAEHPLPESLFVQMEGWLVPVAVSDDEQSESDDNETEQQQSSLLWGHGAFAVVPQGNFPILEALSLACLRVKPPMADRWLGILEMHLRRRESPEVWAAMCRHLQWLHLADKSRAETFLNHLFLTYPTILGSVEGVHLLAYCNRWISPETARTWLISILDQGEAKAAQGMGEVLMLRHVWFSDERWIKDVLDHVLRDGEAGGNLSAARVGVAHAVANLWREQEHRALVHGYLLQLLQITDESVLRALANVFRRGELIPDQASRDLLGALCAYPAILGYCAESVSECLVTILHVEPELVCGVCNALLDLGGTNLGNIASSQYLISEPIITIAMALQDFGGQHQASGTALFERMLEFNVPQARDLMLGLDKRTPRNLSAMPIRRRRRKRTKNS